MLTTVALQKILKAPTLFLPFNVVVAPSELGTLLPPSMNGALVGAEACRVSPTTPSIAGYRTLPRPSEKALERLNPSECPLEHLAQISQRVNTDLL